ncbi:hypothetical protein CRYUN_Cryun25bG0124600 [Craigia yunnanensis]
MEAVRQEIHKGRTAIECEKKTRASNLEQRQILDKNITIVAREIEKLHAEYVNAEKRARVAATVTAANPNPTYNGNYGNIDDGKHGGSSYPNRYSMPQVCLFPISSLDSVQYRWSW